jgi:2-desacetyl-2-hydroxyethyl bacteriochlorophyllide A dehydrogenase
MKALVYSKKEVPSKLVFANIDKPTPSPNEVLVKIKASSINAADYRSMSMGVIPKNKIFGADIAGVIESVGVNVSQFKPGDEVIGDLSNSGFGGFAEYVAASELVITHKPKNLNFAEAAAIPLAGVTALQSIYKAGGLQAGQKVLVVGSGGGVGSYAVQFAKYFGAEVTAVCSTRNVEQAKLIGADFIIDYSQDDFAKSEKRFDLIIAINGNRSLFTYKQMLNACGKYVMVGGAMSQIINSLVLGKFLSFGSKKMLSLAAKPNQNDLAFIVRLVEEGRVKPLIDKHYPFDQAIEAMNYASEGHARGKVVISMED